jgi:hypothetical protein
MSALLPQLLVATALALEPGGTVTIAGAVETTYDGARIHPADMFDAAAGGLRVVERDGARVVYAANGVGPTCAALGIASPCLVPRLADHAHARLLDVESFRGTLRGGYDLSIATPPPPPSPAPLLFRMVALLAITGALTSLLIAIFTRRALSPLGRVDAAARTARRAVGTDPTLRVIREEIERLVEHARDVERVRIGCEAALKKVRAIGDRLAIEREEESRLEADLARARARLTEIAAALRLVPLRVREAVKFGASPIDAILGELHLREQATLEADR